MAGGEITIGILLGAGSLIGLVYAGSRLLAAIAANKFPPLPIYGDFPFVNEEMKVGAGGGRGGASSGADLRNSQKQTQLTDPFRTGTGGK